MVTIWTVGHSTRSSNEFTQLLLDHDIEALVDVRSFPGSRRYPHFNRTHLAEQLHSNDVEYFHLPSLGGRRKPRADSQNTAWQNASFRAYADHMETEEFEQGIRELLRIGSLKRTAIMCAEAVWWSCHRSLISDYLKSNEVEVLHLVNSNRIEPHPYTAAARIVDAKLSYRGLLPEL